MSYPGHVWECDVAMRGRDPVEAVIGALIKGMDYEPGQVWNVTVAHEEGCSASERGMEACDCEVVEIRARRLS